MKTTALWLAAITILSAGCSNQQAYNAARDNRLHECQYRQPSEREKCLRHYERTYEEYERERKDVVGE